ncbi:MAG TPA: acyltransferase family protein [Ktedonosporobacter sp.]|nr:acyltransferase family protein [Ktedonosporobacter sp.]
MSSLPEQTTPVSGALATTAIGPLEHPVSHVRIFFLDHLRVALTILVVLHHLALIYGAGAAFYYLEPPTGDLLAFLVLLAFVLMNQGYFMGCFFLISGYFTPGSFDHKGPAAFLKDRALRLGIPLLIFVLVLSPLASIGLYYWASGVKGSFISLYPTLIGVGPLWFVEMLLFFCLGYIIWRLLGRERRQPGERVFGLPSYRAVGLFILALATASYLMRVVVPMGVTIPIFGFPTLSYLPQYLSFFVLGVIAFRRNWFQTIPGSMGRTGFIVALVATMVLFPLAVLSSTTGATFLGQGSWQSAVYALWDSTFSVGMCLGLLTFFRRFFNQPGKPGRFLSRHAYTVYIIHAPIIVLLALALRGVHLESLLKFVLAALIGVPLCFVLAFLVRKIPFASRIL